MKFKLDENLGQRGAQVLKKYGFDVATVVEQSLCSASDPQLIEICHREERCLVTLDMDFSNPFLFNPRHYSGIAVIRLSVKSSPNDLYQAIDLLGSVLMKTSITGKLWIIQNNKIREYQSQ